VRWLRSLGQLPGLAVGTLALIPARRIAGRKLAGIPRVRHRETNIRPGGHAERVFERSENRVACRPGELGISESSCTDPRRTHARRTARTARCEISQPPERAGGTIAGRPDLSHCLKVLYKSTVDTAGFLWYTCWQVY
jgi:hypothetical protein